MPPMYGHHYPYQYNQGNIEFEINQRATFQKNLSEFQKVAASLHQEIQKMNTKSTNDKFGGLEGLVDKSSFEEDRTTAMDNELREKLEYI